MKRILALTMVLVLVAVSGTFTSCCCPDTEIFDELMAMIDTQSVVGTWEGYVDGSEMIFNFEEDGTGTIDLSGISVDMTWETEDGLLYADITMMGLTEELFDGAEYSISGDTLTINVDGDYFYFEKQ